MSGPYPFAGRDRANPTPRSTHLDNWRLVLTSAAPTRSQPGIGRPRIAGHRRPRLRLQLLRPFRADPDEDAALAAGGDSHVPADEEGHAAEHLLHGEAPLGGDQGPDPISEILVVGHRTRVRNLLSERVRVLLAERWRVTPARPRAALYCPREARCAPCADRSARGISNTHRLDGSGSPRAGLWTLRRPGC